MTKKEKENNKVWMVRAGVGNLLIDSFLNKGIVAIGWNDVGDLSSIETYKDLKLKLQEVYPDWSAGKLAQTAGQLWKFYNDFSKGDKVITYDSVSREYHLGVIVSDYKFSKKFEYQNYREVHWNYSDISRDSLRVETKNTLGAILTIFELSNEIWEELMMADPGYISDEEKEEYEQVIQQMEDEKRQKYQEEALESLKEDAVARSTEFIKDIVYNLNWQETELLVAGILRAMGYKTRLTNKGSDLGSDIMASPDGLEMVEPIIKTEVKHKTKSKGKIGAPDLRNFIGGLRPPTRGIYVSTTGFSKEAYYEAERANFQITLVDLNRLVDLIVEYYEQLDTETKALVPLRKIYWPV